MHRRVCKAGGQRAGYPYQKAVCGYGNNLTDADRRWFESGSKLWRGLREKPSEDHAGPVRGERLGWTAQPCGERLTEDSKSAVSYGNSPSKRKQLYLLCDGTGPWHSGMKLQRFAKTLSALFFFLTIDR